MAITQAQLVDLLTEYRRENWKGIQTPAVQLRVVRSLAAETEPIILRRIAPYWQLPANALILDLGSGVGNFVIACRKRGLRAFGVEPDRIGQGASTTALQIAGKRLDCSAFAAAVGEQLPFRDCTFDLVVLDQVIEHVKDQKRVLAEALRVLKPGGALYVACPNYLEFYESHYKVWFLPLMPKALARVYLRLRSRDPMFLDQITYTTNWRVRKLLESIRVRFIDLNREDLLTKFKTKAFVTRKAGLLKGLATLPALGKAVIWGACFYLQLREGGSEMLLFKDAGKSL